MRRCFEITDDKADAYQLLSKLLHEPERAIQTRESKDGDGNHPEMEGTIFSAGYDQISNDLPRFTYSGVFCRVTTITTMRSLYRACTNSYEKLQVCRLIDHDKNDPVIEIVIKQTYDIENEFICQLDPAEFDTIPKYVITEFNKIVETQ